MLSRTNPSTGFQGRTVRLAATSIGAIRLWVPPHYAPIANNRRCPSATGIRAVNSGRITMLKTALAPV